MSRCRHEHAKPSRYLDDWLYCITCATFVKPREAKPGIGDGR